MHSLNKLSLRLLLFAASALCSHSWAANGKLLATPGVMQIEGSAGGGLVPWAQLAGYASAQEIAASAACNHAYLDDYKLSVCSAQINFYDRVELSLAQQQLQINALNLSIKQNIAAVKLRLAGDIVYSPWPQISLGLQAKYLQDQNIAYALGAQKDSDQDVYIAASKLHLGALAGYNWFWNITMRNTQANQLGLLGFGSATTGQQRRWQIEASSAIFINQHWAIGLEYRQKPDQLAIKEEDWRDLFIAWFPNKSISVTAAWLELGTIAGAPSQRGWYLSLAGYL